MNGTLVQDYLARTAGQYPDKLAVTGGGSQLTFGELAAKSDRLAGCLRELGVRRGDRVVYFQKRSPACITATLGILKAGAAYIPLDQKTPPERWRRIVEDATPRVIVCDASTLPETLHRLDHMAAPLPVVSLGPRPALSGMQRQVCFEEELAAAAGGSPPGGLSPQDVAYVLYTSGSTGAPKGVMVTHANVCNYIDWAVEYFQINPQDRILGTAPFYFDMSTFDIHCALASGATLSLATEDLLLFPQNLARKIEQEEISLWKGVSSLLMYLVRAGVVQPGRMPSLRTVIFAGEPLGAQYLAKWMEALPQAGFFNGYGPTEATGVSLCYHVENPPEPGQPIPIGRPCKGAKVAVIGDDGRPVRPGETGELCIAGDCLAQGYLNDPEKTQKRFTPAPPGTDLGERVYWTGDLVRQTPAGDYIFVSRVDHQVKWMGYRIELAEIESNLMAHPHVRDAVVLLVSAETNGLTELAAFYEAEGEVEPAILAGFLKDRLPPYMIPKRYIRLAALPRNDRGKVDREQLQERYANAGETAIA